MPYFRCLRCGRHWIGGKKHFESALIKPVTLIVLGLPDAGLYYDLELVGYRLIIKSRRHELVHVKAAWSR